jgi:hypothetical protein
MELITLKDFSASFDDNKDRVKQITKDKLNILWFDDYYDGMLSGILEHEGQKIKIRNYN